MRVTLSVNHRFFFSLPMVSREVEKTVRMYLNKLKELIMLKNSNMPCL